MEDRGWGMEDGGGVDVIRIEDGLWERGVEGGGEKGRKGVKEGGRGIGEGRGDWGVG